MESVKRMDGAKRIENLVDRLAESHILSREEFCFLPGNIKTERHRGAGGERGDIGGRPIV